MLKATNHRRVLIAGSVMLPGFIGINVLAPPLGTPTYLLLVAIACAGYLGALFSVLLTREPPRGSFFILCILLAP